MGIRKVIKHLQQRTNVEEGGVHRRSWSISYTALWSRRCAASCRGQCAATGSLRHLSATRCPPTWSSSCSCCRHVPTLDVYYRTDTKHWFFPLAFFGTTGTGSMLSVVQHLMLLRYTEYCISAPPTLSLFKNQNGQSPPAALPGITLTNKPQFPVFSDGCLGAWCACRTVFTPRRSACQVTCTPSL